MEFIDNITPDYGTYYSQTAGQSPWTLGQAARNSDAYNQWAQMYYPNAYQTALLNFQNEYDKPINQMLRYQEAGLNPYSFQPMQSSSGSQGAKPGSGTPAQSLQQEKIGNSIRAVSSLSQAAKVAQDLYDYLKFGRFESFYNTAIARYNADSARERAYQESLKSGWETYWNTGGDSYLNGTSNLVSESPRAKYMKSSTDRINMQIAQLSSLINEIYPSQAAQNQARTALMKYQKEVMQGNFDAILSIDTGYDWSDKILKLLAFKFLSMDWN